MADAAEQTPIPDIPPGQKLMNDAVGAGYSRDEVAAWKAKKYADGIAQGYNSEDIKKYFGDDKEPDMKPMVDHFKDAIEEAKPKDADGKPKPVEKHEAQTYLESLKAGFQNSVTGLDLDKAPPNITPNQHADIAMRLLQQVGQVAGDLPEMIVGGALGGFSGGLGGALVTKNPVGAAVAGVVGAGYGAQALPEAMRTWMMDGYEKGEIRDASDFASRIVHAAWEGHKQGVVGALTAGTGAMVKPVAGPIAALLAEIPTMTIAGAAIQGRIPEPHEFLDGAIMVVGLHGATEGFNSVMPKKMANVYRNTGEPPSTVVDTMQKDVVFNQEMHSENPDLPAQASREPLERVAPEEEVPEGKNNEPTEPPKEGEPPAPEDLVKKFNKYIGETPVDEKAPLFQRLKDGFHDWYATHMDFTYAMQKALNEVNAKPDAEDNPVILTRLHAGYMDKLQHFIEKGTLDGETKTKNGESMQDIQNDYAKKFPDDPNREVWKAVGIAERAIEKSTQRSSGSGKLKEISVNGEKINLDEARQLVKDHPEVREFIDRRTAYGNRVIDYAHASGIWTEEQVKAMREANLSYIDMNRIMEPDGITGKTKGSRGVKELHGEGGLFQDPMLSWLKNTDAILRMAEENHIKRKLVENLALTEEHVDERGKVTIVPHPDALLAKVETDMKPVKIDEKELNAGLMKQGIELNDQTLEGITVFRPAEKRLGPNRMEVHIDGKREVYEGPSELIDAVNRLKGNATATDVFGKILKGFAAVERMGTVGTPWFAVKHAWRQQITAGTYSKEGYNPIADSVSGALSLKFDPKTKELWNQFFVDGGAVSSVNAFNKTWIDSKIYELNKEIPFMDKQWNRLENAAQLSHVMILNHDNMIRFQEYKGALESGKSRVEAAFAAREVLPDFQKAGLRNAFLFQQTAFLKVHLQGLDRMWQAGAEDVQQIKETGLNANNNFIRAVTGITLPHLLLAAANWGDKDVEQLEPFQRYGYFNLPVDKWEKTTLTNAMALKGMRDDLIRQDKDGNYEYNNKIMFRLQNPFTTGIMFGGVADAALEALHKKDPQAIKDWMWNVAGSTVAVPIPNFASAPVAQAANYEAFTGRPVVSIAKEKLVPEMQYDQYTSETAKTLGKMIQAVPFVGDVANQIGPAGRKITSPMVIDMYIREMTGTMGQLAVMAIDKSLREAGVAQVKNEPEATWSDYPIIREFVWRHPTMKAESITKFTEEYQAATQATASIQAKIKEASFNPAAAQEALAMQQQYSSQIMGRLAGPHEAIRNMSQLVQGIRLDPSMSPVDKRQLTDQLYYRMVMISQDANKQIDGLKKMVKTQQQGAN